MLFFAVGTSALIKADDNAAAAGSENLSVRERSQMSQLADAELKRWSFTSAGHGSALSVSEPAMRWSYFDNGRYYGDLYVVKSKQRPVAVFAMFRWFHPVVRSYACATCLDESGLVARRNGKTLWQPRTSALEWKSIQDLRPPAGSQSYRLTQMRRIARRFSGEVSESRLTNQFSSKKVRLLPQPIYRYSSENVDGAIFAFANGTTPAVLLCVEADLDPTKTSWRYAIARRWSFESRMKLDDQEVWTSPSERPPTNPRDPYYLSVLPEKEFAN